MFFVLLGLSNCGPTTRSIVARRRATRFVAARGSRYVLVLDRSRSHRPRLGFLSFEYRD